MALERIRPQPAVTVPGRRKSVFVEVGLADEEVVRRERSPAPTAPRLIPDPSPRGLRPVRMVRFRSTAEIFEHESTDEDTEDTEWESDSESDDNSATIRIYPRRQMSSYSRMYRLGVLGILLALMLPILQANPIEKVGVKGGVIPTRSIESADKSILKREDTNTDVCKRWSHQATIVNGTLYIYGGHASNDSTQTSGTWTNDFLTLDLTKSWQISNPSLTGLPIPSGPPAVSNGYLWNSMTSLYMYGGEFSDTPVELPTSNSLWEYNIGGKQWYEHKNPTTSAGNNSEPSGEAIQRSAEGAGFGVSTLGRGWYFGGHLDYLTTEGWSVDVPRIYLKSLVEFTFPGYSNNGVQDLSTAGVDGVWRNVTQGGAQTTDGFTERADGLLLYVPGFGSEGLLLGLAGGVNATFTQMNVIDVYDIGNSTWYKQSTSGTVPQYRVNPCAVVAAAADGSSYNVYMFGGQNLQPYKNQTQYQDMWILSIPSFTWIEVDQSDQSIPYARAGHTCNVWDGQMIVVGGYVDPEISCESPGIYVFNMSSLTWSNQFTALTGDKALLGYSGKASDSGNPLAQQANQRGFGPNAGLEGSYGYDVPAAVQSVIGGTATGGATLTAPVQTPTGGPLATGKPETYTVTGANGATITETAIPSSNGSTNKGTKIGAIVAGVCAGVLFFVAGYMAFCAWIYRKQVKIWKQHAAMVTARAHQEKNDPFAAPGATFGSSNKNSSERNRLTGTNTSSAGRPSDEDRIGYVGAGAGAAGLGLGQAPGSADGRRRSSSGSSSDDLLEGQEPTFWGTRGVLLNPRRSLRVINRD